MAHSQSVHFILFFVDLHALCRISIVYGLYIPHCVWNDVCIMHVHVYCREYAEIWSIVCIV